MSAGLELMKPNHPVNRAVRMAEQRLEAAKDAERDRVSAFDEQPLNWRDYEDQLKSSGLLLELLREGQVSQVFAYRILYFAEERRRAEAAGPLDLTAASWRARWGYQLARHLRQVKPEARKREAAGILNALLGLDAELRKGTRPPVSPRPAVTVALYRYRTATERR
jgi:hypothetical protein